MKATDVNVEASINSYNERTPLISQSPISRTSSSTTVPITEVSEDIEKSRKRSIWIIYSVMFLASMAFSIMLSSISLFLSTMTKEEGHNEHGHEKVSFLGWVIAAYSLGQMFGAPIFGKWSNARGCKEPLLISVVLNVLGNIMYAFSGVFYGSKYILLGSRTIIGISAGSVAVTRYYASVSSKLSEKPKVFAYLNAFQALGFIIGPAIGAAFSPIKAKQFDVFEFDLYTAPAYFSAFLGIVQFIVLIVWFKEHHIDMTECEVTTDGEHDTLVEHSHDIDVSSHNRRDNVAVVSIIFQWFVMLFVFTLYETIATPMVRDEYGWSKVVAVRNVGIVYAASGVISIGMFAFSKPLNSRFGERAVLFCGFLAIFVGILGYVPWGPVTKTDCAYSVGATWCPYTPTLPLVQFLLAGLVLMLGYPLVQLNLYLLYTKVLGPGQQGTMMGVLTSAGSFARTAGPIFVTNLYRSEGPRWTFTAVSGIVLAGIVMFCATCKRLVPHKKFSDIK